MNRSCVCSILNDDIANDLVILTTPVFKFWVFLHIFRMDDARMFKFWMEWV